MTVPSGRVQVELKVLQRVTVVFTPWKETTDEEITRELGT
ncbi:hypothetical protein A2U01_0116199, partial [Trifolium medium]|nr:hypothetical protein [Trifolium medium]